MGKRGSDDSQLTKEEYESKMNRSSDGPTGSFERASAEELKRRKIRRTSAKWKAAAKTPSKSDSSPSTSNPFGGVNLVAGSASKSAASPAASNPFGSINLVAGSSAAKAPASTAGFSFGATTKASGTSSSTNFGSTNASTSSKSVSFKSPAPAKTVKNERLSKFCTMFTAAMANPKGNHSDILKTMEKFTRVTTFIKKQEGLLTSAVASNESPPAPMSTPAKPKMMPAASTPAPPGMFGAKPASPATTPIATPKFSFAATPGPAPTPGPFGMTPAPKAGEIPDAFAPTPTAASSPSKPLFPPVPAAAAGSTVPFSFSTNAASAPKFSFSSAPATVPAQAPAPTTSFSAPTDDGEKTTEDGENEDDGDEKRESSDVDWDEIDSIKVVVNVKDSDTGVFSKSCTGWMKLQSHKTKSNVNRIVMRDDHGINVHLNMSINADMTFAKGPESKSRGSVLFVGMRDENEGPRQFRLDTLKANAPKLLQGLIDLSKK